MVNVSNFQSGRKNKESYNPTPKVIKPVVISSAASVTTAVITASIKAVVKVVAFAAVRIWICK